jgi:hypothetical protein
MVPCTETCSQNKGILILEFRIRVLKFLKNITHKKHVEVLDTLQTTKGSISIIAMNIDLKYDGK